jgi:hypothetical protein
MKNKSDVTELSEVELGLIWMEKQAQTVAVKEKLYRIKRRI